MRTWWEVRRSGCQLNELELDKLVLIEREGRREGAHTLEKFANMEDCFGLTASEMTGAGTNILVKVYCTCPSVKESMEEQSTPNMAQTSPALMLSISSS